MNSVFVDTSGWIALLSANDRIHAAAARRYDELSKEGVRLLTNYYVIEETATRLRYGLGLRASLEFHTMMLAATSSERLRLMWVDEKTESESWRILQQYADVKLSLTDAACAASARSAHAIENFGCDSDFEALGFVVRPGHV